MADHKKCLLVKNKSCNKFKTELNKIFQSFNFTQNLNESKQQAQAEMDKWREAESVSRSLSDWLSTVEAEHQDCIDTEGGSLLTAVRVCDSYQSRVEDYRDALDRLRGQSQSLQELTRVGELPELDDKITELEGRLVEADERHGKLSQELQQVNGMIDCI